MARETQDGQRMLTVTMDTDLYNAIQAAAAMERRSMAGFVRATLTDKLLRMGVAEASNDEADDGKIVFWREEL